MKTAQDQNADDGMQAWFVVKTVGRKQSTQKYEKREKLSRRCLPLTRPGAGVYICRSEGVR